MVIASQPPPTDPAAIADVDRTSVEVRQWTYKEVAAIKRVSTQTVMEWVKRGMVPSPVYTGYTARFTPAQVSQILSGTSAPGTYVVTPSPRSAVGKLGGGSKMKKKGKSRNAAQQKRDARPKPNLKPISPRRSKPAHTGLKQATKKGGK